MNVFIPIITLSAMLSAFGDETPVAASADNSDAVPVAPAQPPPGDVDPTPGPTAIEKSQAKFDKARKRYAELRQEADEQATQAAQAAVAELAGGRYTERVQNAVRRAPGNPNRSLIIRTAETDPKEQSNFEEDLTVMSHLLDKAVKDNLGSGWDRKAMGIDVVFTPGATPVRSLYLDGYGALFMVNVTFPVLAPAGDPEAAKEKPMADSSWDEAKREVYGQHGDGKFSASSGEQFNEEKSTKLKNTLLEALKNATNIRGLKPDDAITVCVFGSPVPITSKNRAKAKPPTDSEGQSESTPRPSKNINFSKSSGRGTMMTIRILKSDVDAFANGKLNLDRFREKAKFTSYAGGALGAPGNMTFINNGFGGGVGFGGSYAGGGGYGTQ